MNSRFVIAVHILTLLANSDEPLSSPYLAGSIGVNPVTVRKVVKVLNNCRIIDTFIGSSGGALLARGATSITLRDVYLCIREEALFGKFPQNPNPNCIVGRNIQAILEGVLSDTEQKMLAPLADITVADLLEQVHQRELTNLIN